MSPSYSISNFQNVKLPETTQALGDLNNLGKTTIVGAKMTRVLESSENLKHLLCLNIIDIKEDILEISKAVEILAKKKKPRQIGYLKLKYRNGYQE